MKIAKQLEKLNRLLDEGSLKKRKHRSDLKELLGRLKLKEKHLIQKLKREETPKAQALLRQEIDMLHAQRKKGVRALKSIEQ